MHLSILRAQPSASKKNALLLESTSRPQPLEAGMAFLFLYFF